MSSHGSTAMLTSRIQIILNRISECLLFQEEIVNSRTGHFFMEVLEESYNLNVVWIQEL